MKSVDYAQAQERLDEILTEVQRQPIVICRQGQDPAILSSMDEDERLRVSAVREFVRLRNDIAQEANTAGLTEDRLTTTDQLSSFAPGLLARANALVHQISPTKD